MNVLCRGIAPKEIKQLVFHKATWRSLKIKPTLLLKGIRASASVYEKAPLSLLLMAAIAFRGFMYSKFSD
jgi:hypothetical protein